MLSKVWLSCIGISTAGGALVGAKQSNPPVPSHVLKGGVIGFLWGLCPPLGACHWYNYWEIRKALKVQSVETRNFSERK
jgi:hypothetical protein